MRKLFEMKIIFKLFLISHKEILTPKIFLTILIPISTSYSFIKMIPLQNLFIEITDTRVAIGIALQALITGKKTNIQNRVFYIPKNYNPCSHVEFYKK